MYIYTHYSPLIFSHLFLSHLFLPILLVYYNFIQFAAARALDRALNAAADEGPGSRFPGCSSEVLNITSLPCGVKNLSGKAFAKSFKRIFACGLLKCHKHEALPVSLWKTMFLLSLPIWSMGVPPALNKMDPSASNL